MQVHLIAKGKHSAEVLVDGVRFGDASDCDMGRWIISADNSPVKADPFNFDVELLPLEGCYPARDLAGLAFAIRECVDGVSSVTYQE